MHCLALYVQTISIPNEWPIRVLDSIVADPHTGIQIRVAQYGRWINVL